MSAAYRTLAAAIENHRVITGDTSSLPTSLGGTSGEPIGDRKYPADFGRKIFAAPWTTSKVVRLPDLIFSQLPFAKGGILFTDKL